MHFKKNSKYSPKYSGPKTAPLFKFEPHLDSTIVDWSRTAKNIVLIVLDQVAVLDLKLGPEVSDDNFFRPLYFGLGNNLLRCLH